jgi:hypothetical protein
MKQRSGSNQVVLENLSFDVGWWRQTRRDGRIIIASFAMILLLILVVIAGLAWGTAYITGESNAFTKGWWHLPAIPVGGYLLTEAFLLIDKIFVYYRHGEKL